MVDREYNTDSHNYSKISIGTVIKNLARLKFVPDHLKTKKIVTMKLLLLIRYVRDQYKTQQICDNAILENDGTLECVPECY